MSNSGSKPPSPASTVANTPQFVNIAAAPTKTQIGGDAISKSDLVTLSADDSKQNMQQGIVLPVSAVNATSTPGSPTITGAINLTISNGAINVKPATTQPLSTGQGPSNIGSVVKTKIAGPGALQFPILSGGPQSTLNVRLAPQRGTMPRVLSPRSMTVFPAQLRGPQMRGVLNQDQSAQLKGPQNIVLGKGAAFILPQGTKVGQLPAGTNIAIPATAIRPTNPSTSPNVNTPSPTITSSVGLTQLSLTPITIASSLPIANQAVVVGSNPVVRQQMVQLATTSTTAAVPQGAVTLSKSASDSSPSSPSLAGGTMKVIMSNPTTAGQSLLASNKPKGATYVICPNDSQVVLAPAPGKAGNLQTSISSIDEKSASSTPSEKKSLLIAGSAEKKSVEKKSAMEKKVKDKKQLEKKEKKINPEKKKFGLDKTGSMPNIASGKKVVKKTIKPQEKETTKDLKVATDEKSPGLKQDPVKTESEASMMKVKTEDDGKDAESLVSTGSEDNIECNAATNPDVDFADTLEWKDGIGTLPGSDLKFRKNEFGVCEMIMDDLDNLFSTESLNAHISTEKEVEETEEPSSSTDVSSVRQDEENEVDDEEENDSGKDDSDKEYPKDTEDKEETSKIKDEPMEIEDGVSEGGASSELAAALTEGMADTGDDIIRCESCSMYGMRGEFIQNGRFCSKACAASFATKKLSKNKTPSSSQESKSSSSSAAGQPLKKKKRKLTSPVENTGEFKAPKLSRDSDEEGSTCSTESKKPVPTVGSTKKRGWTWSNYLEKEKASKAPVKLFKEHQAFPAQKNSFKVGMKLEGIDPQHPSKYCVLTVAEVKGFRLRLHFDGFSECYDFWCNADSPFIFPPGWAERNGKKLQPPKGFTEESFNWSNYLKISKAPSAPKNLFTNTSVASVTPHAFRVGMKLEAIDKKNSYSLTCVATVADVLGEKILIHFDGWEDVYDYWSEPSSPYIHPVGWCQETGKPLSPPNDWPDIKGFTWEKYLDQTKSTCVPARAFKTRSAPAFEEGLKLECVDKRNPLLVRVATVIEVEDHQLKIHFDGWSEEYDYWVDDDSSDIHPAGWCARTGHPLTPPPLNYSKAAYASDSGCPTPGCTGIGHIKGAKYTGHHSAFGCPYSQVNMNKEDVLPDRLGSRRGDSEGRSSQQDYLEEMEDKGVCPTPGCDGSGHITGKWTSHYKLSGCPSAEINKDKVPIPAPKTELAEHIKQLNNGRPLFGPGSGRGRKKAKLIKLLQQEKELQMKGENPDTLLATLENGESLQQGIHQSVFMSSMMPSAPSRDLPLNWDQHSKLLPGVDSHQAGDVARWTSQQVAGFVQRLPGCEDLAHLFEEEQIDGEAFLLMNQQDMVKVLNLKLGPALKIYNSILMFKNNVEI